MGAGGVGVHAGKVAQREGAVEVAVLEDELAHTVRKPPHRVAQLRQRHLSQVPAPAHHFLESLTLTPEIAIYWNLRCQLDPLNMNTPGRKGRMLRDPNSKYKFSLTMSVCAFI